MTHSRQVYHGSFWLSHEEGSYFDSPTRLSVYALIYLWQGKLSYSKWSMWSLDLKKGKEECVFPCSSYDLVHFVLELSNAYYNFTL